MTKITKKIEKLPYNVERDDLYSIFENCIKLNLNIECQLCEDQNLVNCDLNKFEVNESLAENQNNNSKIFNVCLTKNGGNFTITSSRNFYIDILFPLILKKLISKCPLLQSPEEILGDLIFKIDSTDTNKNIKLFTFMMTNLGLNYNDATDLYNDIIRLKCLKDGAHVIDSAQCKESPQNDDLYTKYINEIPTEYMKKFQDYCQHYIFKTIEKNPGITQVFTFLNRLIFLQSVRNILCFTIS